MAHCSVLIATILILSSYVVSSQTPNPTSIIPIFHPNNGISQIPASQHDQTISSMSNSDRYLIHYFADPSPCNDRGPIINLSQFIQRHDYKIKVFAVNIEDRSDAAVQSILQRHSKIREHLRDPLCPFLVLFVGSPDKAVGYHGDGLSEGGTIEDILKWLKSFELFEMKDLSAFSKEYCMHSISGPHSGDTIIDSKGWICSLMDINPATGCCTTLKGDDAHSVSLNTTECDDYFPCCHHYESCIGCCLHRINPKFNGETIDVPFHTNDRLRLINIENEHFPNFTHCKRHCRTSSRSTFEGNTYTDYRPIHCYAEDMIKYEDPMRLLKHVSGGERALDIVAGAAGASCDRVCKEKNAKCVDDYELNDKVVNQCTTIKKYFGEICEKDGCLFGYEEVFPIVDEGKKKCYLKATLAKTTGNYSCAGFDDEGVGRRLCLCETVEGVEMSSPEETGANK